MLGEHFFCNFSAHLHCLEESTSLQCSRLRFCLQRKPCKTSLRISRPLLCSGPCIALRCLFHYTSSWWQIQLLLSPYPFGMPGFLPVLFWSSFSSAEVRNLSWPVYLHRLGPPGIAFHLAPTTSRNVGWSSSCCCGILDLLGQIGNILIGLAAQRVEELIVRQWLVLV